MLRTMMSTNNNSPGLDAGAQRWYNMPDTAESTFENVEWNIIAQWFLQEGVECLMVDQPVMGPKDWKHAFKNPNSLSLLGMTLLKLSQVSETALDGADRSTNGAA